MDTSTAQYASPSQSMKNSPEKIPRVEELLNTESSQNQSSICSPSRVEKNGSFSANGSFASGSNSSVQTVTITIKNYQQRNPQTQSKFSTTLQA